MEIITGYPPNFDEIAKVLPGAHKEGIIFAYHPYVYKPHGKPELRRDLIAHEEVHLNRQAGWRGGPGRWWKDYISSAVFRFEEERLAHLAEAKSLAEQQSGQCNRKKRREIAAWVGGRLSAPLYKAGVSKKGCVKLIKASL